MNSIPLTDANFLPEQSPGEVAPTYDAVATINHHIHSASNRTGHYTATVLNDNGQWHHMDDSQVKQCTEGSVICENTQLIAFVRRGSERSADLANPPCAAAFAYAGLHDSELFRHTTCVYVLSISHD